MNMNPVQYLGPILLGTVAATMMYGITNAQIFAYFTCRPKDRPYLRNLILSLWVLDSVHTVLIVHGLFYYCVSNFNAPEVFNRVVWSVWTQVYITCISELIVRGLFTQRVWYLSQRSIPIVSVITLLSVVHCVGGFYLSSRMIERKTIENIRSQSETPIFYLAFSCGAASDVIIASSLVRSLWKARTGFLRTDRLIATLMMYSINTGLFTSLWSVLCVITFAASSNTLIFLGCMFLIPKLSLNALLATLNKREELRGGDEVLQPMELVDHPSHKGLSVLRIDVETNVEVMGDERFDSDTGGGVETELATPMRLLVPIRGILSDILFPSLRHGGMAELAIPRDALILYATETGRAQDVSEQIQQAIRRIHFKCRVVNMESYDPPDLIHEDVVIFVVSTTGSGAEPREMTPLWSMLLRSGLPEDLFEDMVFAVFGLGDSAYEKFCWPAKKLDRRLESLGASRLCDRGEGDDQHAIGIDGALGPWCDTLVKALLELFPLPPELEILTDEPGPRVSLRKCDSGDQSPRPPPGKVEYYTTRITKNERITASDWFQDVRHLEFEFNEDVRYNPGDVAVIHPEVSAQQVDDALEILGWLDEADCLFSIESTSDEIPLPDRVPKAASLRAILTQYVDVAAVPYPSFFRNLLRFTTNETERERLEEFLSSEGADELYEYCFKVRRTILEVLSEFRHIRIPKEFVFDVFPPLRPRQFSISSSVKRHPRQVHLCIAIVQYRTKLKVPRRGVCTSYITTLKPDDHITLGIQPGLLKLPEDPSTPIICVGPGTGIAPMRAVIEDRIEAGFVTPSTLTLYFGCRSAVKDQHYHEEWEDYASRQLLTYRVACSRDGPEGVKRTYVQDLIREDARSIWNLVDERGAWILISGSSNKMPAAVKEAIRHSAEAIGGMDADEAKGYLDALERKGRLIEECWS